MAYSAIPEISITITGSFPTTQASCPGGICDRDRSGRGTGRNDHRQGSRSCRVHRGLNATEHDDVIARRRIEIPAELPTIQADREGLLQILGQLLQNASNVTPENGSITLKAGLRKEDASDFLIIQVTDQGGGIAPEDLPNVFNRRFKAENALIQGIGDTGVGLSIARSMVEAHRGRIWVESANAQSSTYSVLLPISQRTEKDPGA